MLLNIAFKAIHSLSRSSSPARRHVDTRFSLEVLETRTVMTASLPAGCDFTPADDQSEVTGLSDDDLLDDSEFDFEFEDDVLVFDELEESAVDAELDALCDTSEFDTDYSSGTTEIAEDVLAYSISVDDTDLYSAEITVLDQDLDEVATDEFLFELDDYLMQRFASGEDFALEEGLVEFFVLDASSMDEFGIDGSTDADSLQATLDAYGIADRDNAYDFIVVTSDDGFEIYDIPNSDIGSNDTDIEVADLSPAGVESTDATQVALGTPTSDVAVNDTEAATNDADIDVRELAEAIPTSSDLSADTLIAANAWSPYASTDGQWVATSDPETNQAVLTIVAALVRTKSAATATTPELAAIQRSQRQSAIEELAQIQFQQASGSASDEYAVPTIHPRVTVDLELPRPDAPQIDRAFGDQRFSIDSLEESVAGATTASDGEFSYSQIASMIGLTLVAASGCAQVSRRNGWWLMWRMLRAWTRGVC